MKKIPIISFLLIFLINSLYAQVTADKSSVHYSLKTKEDNIVRILTFWKDKDSTVYTSVKYSVSGYDRANNINLKDEISTVQKLWEIAEDSILFELTSFNIGYPQQYHDVLKAHILAFIESEEWQNHVKQHGKKLDYPIIQKVMLETNIYKPLDDFLKTKGYFVSGFDTEKHGFVTKENLQKAGFSGNEIVPMPYMVWLILSKY